MTKVLWNECRWSTSHVSSSSGASSQTRDVLAAISRRQATQSGKWTTSAFTLQLPQPQRHHHHHHHHRHKQSTPRAGSSWARTNSTMTDPAGHAPRAAARPQLSQSFTSLLSVVERRQRMQSYGVHSAQTTASHSRYNRPSVNLFYAWHD